MIRIPRIHPHGLFAANAILDLRRTPFLPTPRCALGTRQELIRLCADEADALLRRCCEDTFGPFRDAARGILNDMEVWFGVFFPHFYLVTRSCGAPIPLLNGSERGLFLQTRCPIRPSHSASPLVAHHKVDDVAGSSLSGKSIQCGATQLPKSEFAPSWKAF